MIRRTLNNLAKWIVKRGLADGDPALVELLGGGNNMGAGVAVTERSALSASAVFACVRNVAEDEAKLPFKVFRYTERGRDTAESHPAYRLLDQRPNPDMTAMAFRTAMTACALLYGRGIAEIEWAQNGKPLALHVLEPWRIKAQRDSAGRMYFWWDGRKRLDVRDTLYLPGVSLDGIVGEMVARLGKDSIGLCLAAQKFAGSFFANGGKPSLVLTTPGKLSDLARKNVKASWQTEHGGPDKAGGTALLEEGLKPEKLSFNPEESQALESRQFAVEDVCRWFRVPPHKVGHLLRASGWSTLEATNTDYVIDCLMPWLIRWEQEVNEKLLGSGYFAKHMVQGLMRGDSQARGAFYREMFGVGAMTINEIRALEDMNPIGPEGDTHFVPLNMVNANDARNGEALKFKRELVKTWAAAQPHGTVLYNIADIPDLMEGAGVKLDGTINSKGGDGVPLLPVIAKPGAMVSGSQTNDDADPPAMVGGDVALKAEDSPETNGGDEDAENEDDDE